MSPLPDLSTAGRDRLDALLSDYTEPERDLPCVFFGIANAKQVLYEDQAGFTDYESPEKKVDQGSILHLFSMSKLVTVVSL